MIIFSSNADLSKSFDRKMAKPVNGRSSQCFFPQSSILNFFLPQKLKFVSWYLQY